MPKKTKTLIVEDNANFRQAIKDILISKFPFMPINQAADGKEALIKLAKQRIDLIFMDIELPGKSGLILTKKIRKTYPHTVIIILTHHDLPEYREAAYKNGAQYFLSTEIEYAGNNHNDATEEIEIFTVPKDRLFEFLTNLPKNTELDLRLPGIIWMLEAKGMLS